MTERHEPPDHLKQQATDAQDAEESRQQRLRWESDFKFILGDKRGRRFMWWLLGNTGLFSNPFRDGSEWAGFHSGKQNVGQQLLAEIHGLCPERYVDMVKEHKEDERSRTRS